MQASGLGAFVRNPSHVLPCSGPGLLQTPVWHSDETQAVFWHVEASLLFVAHFGMHAQSQHAAAS